MAITRTDRNQIWANGSLVSEEVVQVDITADATRKDLLTKAANALTANATFQAIGSPTNAQVLAQVRLLTRQVNALIRLAREDLLVENTDT